MKFSRKLVSILLAVVMMASFGAVQADLNPLPTGPLTVDNIAAMSIAQIGQCRADQFNALMRESGGIPGLRKNFSLMSKFGNKDYYLATDKLNAIIALMPPYSSDPNSAYASYKFWITGQ